MTSMEKSWRSLTLTFHPVSCILYPVSCILYPVSCILYPVSCILYAVCFSDCELLCTLLCTNTITGYGTFDLSSFVLRDNLCSECYLISFAAKHSSSRLMSFRSNPDLVDVLKCNTRRVFEIHALAFCCLLPATCCVCCLLP